MDKHFHFITLVMQSEGVPSVSLSVSVNYKDDIPDPISAPPIIAPPTWDVIYWDQNYWAGTNVPQDFMVPVGKLGYSMSPWVMGVTSGSGLRWYATRVVFEKTQGLVLA
jgi:hypothetical protein